MLFAVCDVKVFLGEHLRSESHNFDERIQEQEGNAQMSHKKLW